MLVLDTNVWLDWLLFADPSVAPLKAAVKEGRAEIFIDAACEAELVRVLAYDLGRHSIDAQKQAACIEECRRIAKVLQKTNQVLGLPRCADPADQIFLEAAAAARADYLVTKDRDLLDLARSRLPFRVVQPQFFET
ncbi:MAG TPA: putative toxin-antitoxin system toxin component, PIN family [Burkholderiales bacterium]|nr:putative toxin-antitoxin system toxin component, PIN family [Burkholderiales bacterium]